MHASQPHSYPRSIHSYASDSRPHVELGVFACIISIALCPTIVRFNRILHAVHYALLILLDAVRLLHAGEETEGSLGTLFRLKRQWEESAM